MLCTVTGALSLAAAATAAEPAAISALTITPFTIAEWMDVPDFQYGFRLISGQFEAPDEESYFRRNLLATGGGIGIRLNGGLLDLTPNSWLKLTPSYAKGSADKAHLYTPALTPGAVISDGYIGIDGDGIRTAGLSAILAGTDFTVYTLQSTELEIEKIGTILEGEMDYAIAEGWRLHPSVGLKWQRQQSVYDVHMHREDPFDLTIGNPDMNLRETLVTHFVGPRLGLGASKEMGRWTIQGNVHTSLEYMLSHLSAEQRFTEIAQSADNTILTRELRDADGQISFGAELELNLSYALAPGMNFNLGVNGGFRSHHPRIINPTATDSPIFSIGDSVSSEPAHIDYGRGLLGGGRIGLSIAF